MTDIVKIVLTASLTAIFGIFVFCISQIIQRMFLEPIQEQRRLKGKIAHALTYYANYGGMVRTNAPDVVERLNAGMSHLRNLASELRASMYVPPFYKTLASVHLVMPTDTVKEISSELIGWSNSLFDSPMTVDRRTIIAQLLKVNVD